MTKYATAILSAIVCASTALSKKPRIVQEVQCDRLDGADDGTESTIHYIAAGALCIYVFTGDEYNIGSKAE